jgi:hypothetical protein
LKKLAYRLNNYNNNKTINCKGLTNDVDLITKIHFKGNIFFIVFLSFLFILLTIFCQGVYGENQRNFTVIFDDIKIKDKHEMNGFNSLTTGLGEWKIDMYVNENRIPISRGTGLANVDNDESYSLNKHITINLPINDTIRIVSAGFEQDSEHIELPDISKNLKEAIPSIKVEGIEIGGSNLAALYDIVKQIIKYDKNDPIGIINKEYSINKNFGVGKHIDCSIANTNVTDLQEQQATSCDFILEYRIIDKDQRVSYPIWHEWEEINGIPPIISIPDASSLASQNFDVIALAEDGKYWHGSYDYGWETPTTIPTITIDSNTFNPSLTAPTLISWSPDKMYIFAQGVDTKLSYTWYNVHTGKWAKWTVFGDSFISGPTALKVNENAINVYALKNDKYVYERQYNIDKNKWNSNWQKLDFLGNDFTSSPKLILPAGTVDRLEAFALTENASIWHGSYKRESQTWPGHIFTWKLKDKEILSNFKYDLEPSVISTAYGKTIDLYAKTLDNTLISGTYDLVTNKWTKWSDKGKVYSNPIVISPSFDRIDIFALNNTSLLHKWYGK